jgi:hypothetical protein
MSGRSKVFLFRPKLRETLDRRLVESGFGDYAGHVEWLARQGAAISRSALHRYGQALERKLLAAGIPVESTIGGGVRAKKAHIQTGALIVIIEPSTRKTWTYLAPLGSAVARERIERAISSRKRRRRGS